MAFKKFTDNEKQAMAAEYTRGVGLATLSKNFGVSIPTMAKYVRAGGGVVRKPGIIGPVVKSVVVEKAVVPDLIEVVVVEPEAAPVRVLLSMET